MCLHINREATNKIYYKYNDSDTIECFKLLLYCPNTNRLFSPYKEFEYKVGNNKSNCSEAIQRDIVLSNTIQNGIHVFLGKSICSKFAQQFGSPKQVIVEFGAKMKDLIAVGKDDYGNDCAAFEQVTLSEEEYYKAILEGKKRCELSYSYSYMTKPTFTMNQKIGN